MLAIPKSHLWLTTSASPELSHLRLFCFPYGGGSSVIFHRWPQKLPPTIDVCAIKLPGRESCLAEPPFTHLPSLVTALVDAIQPYLDKPFACFGHSLGGLISFELAHELRRRRRPSPLHLFISGSRAPHVPKCRLPVHNLPTPDFIDHLRQLNGTPEEVLRHDSLMALLLPALRADFRMADTHVHTAETLLDCPITGFYGDHDITVPKADVLAWRDLTTGVFTTYELPGDHFFLNRAESDLLTRITNVLAPWLPSIAAPASE